MYVPLLPLFRSFMCCLLSNHFLSFLFSFLLAFGLFCDHRGGAFIFLCFVLFLFCFFFPYFLTMPCYILLVSVRSSCFLLLLFPSCGLLFFVSQHHGVFCLMCFCHAISSLFLSTVVFSLFFLLRSLHRVSFLFVFYVCHAIPIPLLVSAFTFVFLLFLLLLSLFFLLRAIACPVSLRSCFV